MGGGNTFIDEFPHYYVYGSYPGGECWYPASGAFPSRRRSGLDYFYDNVGYEDDPLNYYYVDVPVGSGASFARRRKRDGLVEENLRPRGQNASDIFEEKSKLLHPDFVDSNEVGAKGDVSTPEPSTSKKLSQPRVVSIPIHFSDGGRDDKEVSTVVPEAGIKRSRTANPAERAAVLIQSKFRGYLVRRTQPLAHLRRIAIVRSELVRLNEKTLDPDFIAYARENVTGRLKLSETIMRLLLKLDAVQGAHPVVRDIRKSTSRQVIALQERVDDLLSGRTETMVEHQNANNLENNLPAMQEDVMAQQPAALNESELTGNISYQSAKCEASENPSGTGTNSQGMTPTEHDDNGEKADLSNLKKSDRICIEPATTKDEPADNEGVDVPMGQHRSESFEEETQKCHNFAAECDPSLIEPPEVEQVKERLNQDAGISHVASAKEKAIFMDDDSGKQESSDNIISPAVVMEMDETLGSLDINSEISNVQTIADTVPPESRIESPPANEIECQTCQAAPSVPEEYTNEEDKEWWIEDRDEKATSKVEHQDDIAELYGSKDTPTRTLLEKESMPSTDLNDQAILTIPCVQDSTLPYNVHTQRVHESQLAEYLGISPACDLNYGKFSPASGDDLDRLVGKGDDRALLLKLGKENEVLKSLLMGVIKWNQIQATVMQDVNRRLGQIESRRSRKVPKIGRKKHRSIRMQLM